MIFIQKKNEQIKSYFIKANEKIDSGDAESALEYVTKLEESKEENLANYYLAPLYIDIGAAKEDVPMVLRGIDLIDKNFDVWSKIGSPESMYCKLGDGYLFYYDMTGERYLNNKIVLLEAKNNYRNALLAEDMDSNLKSLILTNLGNVYSKTGRYIDALDCYDLALRENPDFGLAIINKGSSLIEYSSLTNNPFSFIHNAYLHYKEASKKDNLSPEDLTNINKWIEYLEKKYGKDVLNKPHESELIIGEEVTIEGFSKLFCLMNKLYLNTCNYCQKCDSAIGDTILLKGMVSEISTDFEDAPYLKFSSFLNEIKMSYVSSRLYLILSQHAYSNLEFIDNTVSLVNTLSYESQNINTQLLKDAFSNFYNILDKIAYFINDYCKLGIRERGINFKSIWYSECNDNKILLRDLDFDNDGLTALLDINEDLRWGKENELTEPRNALTHRFLKVKLFSINEGDIDEKYLYEKTLELAKIVRNAIIYLMRVVDYEESKKISDATLEVPLL